MISDLKVFDSSNLPQPQQEKLRELTAGHPLTAVGHVEGTDDIMVYVPGQGRAQISPDGSTQVRTHAQMLAARRAGRS